MHKLWVDDDGGASYHEALFPLISRTDSSVELIELPEGPGKVGFCFPLISAHFL